MCEEFMNERDNPHTERENGGSDLERENERLRKMYERFQAKRAMHFQQIVARMNEELKRPLRLTTRRLKNAGAFDYNKFTFTVGTKNYVVPRLQACFISERVCQMLSSDSSSNCLRLDIEDNAENF